MTETKEVKGMVDFSKYSVKELANAGVDFKLVDDSTGEELPVNFVVYGIDADKVTVARRRFNDIISAKGVKPWKEEEAMLDFIVACVKSWSPSFHFGNLEVVDGDKEGLKAFLDECPQFRGQFTEFITEREHFLAK